MKMNLPRHCIAWAIFFVKVVCATIHLVTNKEQSLKTDALDLKQSKHSYKLKLICMLNVLRVKEISACTLVSQGVLRESGMIAFPLNMVWRRFIFE